MIPNHTLFDSKVYSNAAALVRPTVTWRVSSKDLLKVANGRWLGVWHVNHWNHWRNLNLGGLPSLDSLESFCHQNALLEPQNCPLQRHQTLMLGHGVMAPRWKVEMGFLAKSPCCVSGTAGLSWASAVLLENNRFGESWDPFVKRETIFSWWPWIAWLEHCNLHYMQCSNG